MLGNRANFFLKLLKGFFPAEFKAYKMYVGKIKLPFIDKLVPFLTLKELKRVSLYFKFRAKSYYRKSY